MKLRKQNGITGLDIVIAIVVLFIFVSVISIIAYNINSSSKEVELKYEATSIAINEIEIVKNRGFSQYENYDETDGIIEENELKEGFLRTITVQDYTDLEGNELKQAGIVKKVNVKVAYMFKGKTQKVELSAILSKER